MATKTISLDEEAYERLREQKLEAESFSDIVKRLVRERSWRDVAGIWEGEGVALEAAVEAGRGRSRERRDRLTDRERSRTRRSLSTCWPATRLFAAGTPIDPEDCVVGATALREGGPAVTRNVDHFERIDGVEVWTY